MACFFKSALGLLLDYVLCAWKPTKSFLLDNLLCVLKLLIILISQYFFFITGSPRVHATSAHHTYQLGGIKPCECPTRGGIRTQYLRFLRQSGIGSGLLNPVIMCPSTTLSPTSPIKYHGTDEDILTQLERVLLMSRGSPFPSNVIEESPFNVEPSDLPESFWYLLGKGTKKSTEAGYWKLIASSPISSKSTLGTKTIWEFHTYDGERTDWVGKRTDWEMHEYKIDHIEDHQFDMDRNLQDYNSLCKVFRNRGQSSNSEMAAGDEANDDLINAMLLDHVDFEEMNHSSHDSINNSEVVSMDARNLEDQRTHELHHSPTGDFLELKDLIGPNDFEAEGFIEFDDFNDNESCISSSLNSSCLSVTSDEYFNISAVLRQLETSNNDSADRPKMQMDHKFIAPASANHRMVIKPPTSASVHSNSSSKTKNKEAMVASASVPSAVYSASTIKPQPNKVASKHVSAACKESEANREPPISSGGGGKASGRITKLGRFFCLSCF